jgi:16S rRNA processing protein RimM
MNHTEWNLTVGEIVAPFGLSGEMKVRLETDFPDRFARLKQVCIRRPDANGKLYEVTGARPHKGQILLRLQGVATIEDVEPLRNSLVQIQSSEAVRLPANEFYIYELIGCEVVTDSGRSLGCISDVLRGAANDVYVIGSGKQELLLPVIQDVVKFVDTSARKITVTPTPGLLPEEQETGIV